MKDLFLGALLPEKLDPRPIELLGKSFFVELADSGAKLTIYNNNPEGYGIFYTNTRIVALGGRVFIPNNRNCMHLPSNNHDHFL